MSETDSLFAGRIISTAWGQVQQWKSGICVICCEDQICLTYFSFAQNILGLLELQVGSSMWSSSLRQIIEVATCEREVLVQRLSLREVIWYVDLYLVDYIKGSAGLAWLTARRSLGHRFGRTLQEYGPEIDMILEPTFIIGFYLFFTLHNFLQQYV